MGKEDFLLALETALNELDDTELNVIDKAMTEIHEALWAHGLGEVIK